MIQVKQCQLNFTGNFSIREHSFLLWTFDDGTLLHPRILVAFQELNSGILVNKCSEHLFTRLPPFHRNLLVIPFPTWSFRLSPNSLRIKSIDRLSLSSRIRVFLEKSRSDFLTIGPHSFQCHDGSCDAPGF
jgi:hypothetical protein